ncbi:MAG: hypothetical protein C5B55_04725 [Blastocatellia bacterium]|nr:MAG: hypothetical protein C5B55_04725 [Blastocatellia bacterium]
MDNLTHSLVGLAAAKAGLEKLSPGATVLCVLAANAPDADIVVLVFGDRWSFLQHHRGISHSIVGTLVLAILIPLIFYAVDLIWSRLRDRPPATNLRGLLIASVLVSATHPLLDWTNNYGIRLLLPWKSTWFYGDLVFIVDPFIWLVFGIAGFLLTSRTRVQRLNWLVLGTVTTVIVLFAMRRIGATHANVIALLWLSGLGLGVLFCFRKSAEQWGRNTALAAFVFLGFYWSALAYAHQVALNKASAQAAAVANMNGESVSRVAAMPTAANPFGWDVVFETDHAVYRFPLSIIHETSNQNVVRYEKWPPSLAQQIVKLSNDRRLRTFLGFARFPVAQLQDPDCTTQTFVQLADLRYTEPGRSRGSFTLELPVDCASTQSPDR